MWVILASHLVCQNVEMEYCSLSNAYDSPKSKMSQQDQFQTMKLLQYDTIMSAKWQSQGMYRTTEYTYSHLHVNHKLERLKYKRTLGNRNTQKQDQHYVHINKHAACSKLKTNAELGTTKRLRCSVQIRSFQRPNWCLPLFQRKCHSDNVWVISRLDSSLQQAIIRKFGII